MLAFDATCTQSGWIACAQEQGRISHRLPRAQRIASASYSSGYQPELFAQLRLQSLQDQMTTGLARRAGAVYLSLARLTPL